MKKAIQGYVIGVDGGGTKTIVALANLKGKIIRIGKSGSSHPRNLGVKEAINNLSRAIKVVLRKNIKIYSTFIGLPAVAEEFKFRKNKLKKELLRHKEISKVFKGRIEIDSDQKVAFRAGADRDGIMLNCGTGCVAHGWKGKKDVHVSGWGWLADEGGSFFVGQRVFQGVLKNLDGRGQKTLLTKLVFKNLKLKKTEDLLTFVYKENPTNIIPAFSVICDKASKKGDKIAREIIKEAGKEAALAANAVIKKLNFQKKRFPLVLVGSMFKSNLFFEIVKKEIKKFSPKVKFILLKKKPVIGAVKLALEKL